MALCIATRPGFGAVAIGDPQVVPSPVEKFTSVVPGACVIRCQGFEGFTAGQKAAPPPFNDAWKQPRDEHLGVLVVGHNWKSPMLPVQCFRFSHVV